jgi:multiple sugar transport system ATP-binding protein
VASVSFDRVSKVFRDGTRAVSNLTLDVADGELMILVGPSGCGKTTALRMLAGLEAVTEGEIRIGDRVVNGLHPRKRDVAMVFQNYALYPHMTVYRNIAFALKVSKTPADEIRRRVEEAARILGLTDQLEKKPAQLSGGQRQRVAMGRAIVRAPQAFLMDEPLSNLDAKLRVQMRAEIARIQRELGTTTVYVTHDQVEAMTMGHRVAVLRKGELQQVDRPQRLYDRPTNLFVASFIGSPEMNLVEAVIDVADGRIACRVGGQTLEAAPEAVRARPALNTYAGKTVALGIRPEHLGDAGLEGARVGAGRLKGRVVAIEPLGSDLLAYVEVAAAPVVTEELLEVAGDADSALADTLRAEAGRQRTVLVARFSIDSPARPGDQIEMGVETSKLHFFDLHTEDAIDGMDGPV